MFFRLLFLGENCDYTIIASIGLVDIHFDDSNATMPLHHATIDKLRFVCHIAIFDAIIITIIIIAITIVMAEEEEEVVMS